jgi:hypothetical protein
MGLAEVGAADSATPAVPAEAPRDEGDEKDSRRRPSSRAAYCWALLLARIYDVLPLLCTRCGAPMRIVAFVTDRESVRRILEHIGEPSSPPPIAPARGPPQDEPLQDPLADLAFDQTFDVSNDTWA